MKGKFIWMAPLLIFFFSIALYLLGIEKIYHHDELYHVLAARGIIATGEPVIAEGEYRRVFLYTLMLSKLFTLFGESFLTSRITSIVAMAAMLVVMYEWVRRTASIQAALIATVLFALSPFAVDVALFTRFYSFQNFAFFVVAIAVYHIFYGYRNRPISALLVVIFGCVSLYLQLTSVIGFLALICWFVIVSGYRIYQTDLRLLKYYIAFMLTLLIVGIVVSLHSGYLEKYWSMFRQAPLFLSYRSDQYWFYLVDYFKNYPVFVMLFGFLVSAGIRTQPRPVFFSFTLLLVGVVISSLAAAKNQRYLIYLQPFFFIIVGIGIPILVGSVWRGIKRRISPLATRANLSDGCLEKIVNRVTIALVVVAIISNPAFAKSGIKLLNLKPVADWSSIRSTVAKQFENADVVLTTSELDMLYYFGRFDILYSPSRLAENPGKGEFGNDFRTGRPIISRRESIRLTMNCHKNGVLISPAKRWNNPNFVASDVVEEFGANAVLVPLPAGSNVIMYSWENKSLNLDTEACRTIRHVR